MMTRVFQTFSSVLVSRAAAVGVITIVCAILTPSVRLWMLVGYEHARIFATPSAELAYTYGTRHFDSSGSSYNVTTAEYFFREAIRLDPQYPWAHHQVARILFLRSQFYAALAEINVEIKNRGDGAPNSFYMRGLIEGFLEQYEEGENDFRHFLTFEPTNWAATNDLAWVLLKHGKVSEALVALEEQLSNWPENPWLLNALATALFERGQYDEALKSVERAQVFVKSLHEDQWATAYPGNDPRIAKDGLAAFQKSITENKQRIETFVVAQKQ